MNMTHTSTDKYTSLYGIGVILIGVGETRTAVETANARGRPEDNHHLKHNISLSTADVSDLSTMDQIRNIQHSNAVLVTCLGRFSQLACSDVVCRCDRLQPRTILSSRGQGFLRFMERRIEPCLHTKN